MEKTIQAKLAALANLQKIDSKLDRLRQVRGGLPEEVRDLEDELEGLQTRIERLQEDIDKCKHDIGNRNITIGENRDLIKRYDEQLMDVKNNREYEAITKEIEMANLEILTSERKIKQLNEVIADRQEKIAEVQHLYDERNNDLTEKKNELNVIIAETEREEKELLAESAKAAEGIEERLLVAYNKIRRSMRNGLAVVAVDRGACGGCFAIIPPQMQHEIRQRKKIIVCENCGRILVDNAYFESEDAEHAVMEAAH